MPIRHTNSAQASYRRQASRHRAWRSKVSAAYLTAEAAPVATYRRERAHAHAEVSALLPVPAPRGFDTRSFPDPFDSLRLQRGIAARAAQAWRNPHPLMRGAVPEALARLRWQQARTRHRMAVLRLCRPVRLPDLRPVALERAA